MKDNRKLLLGLLAAAGVAVYLRGALNYYRNGFSPHLWLYFMMGCLCLLFVAWTLGTAAASKRRPHKSQSKATQTDGQEAVAGATAAHSLGRRDLLVGGLLLLAFAPLYLYNVHDFPRQMNTDEIVIMNTARTLAQAPDVDIFGPSYYSDLPTFIFWLFGKIGVALGGADLQHMRLVHAGSGVLVIVLVFVLLRLMGLPRYAAVAGAAVLGLNHSFFMLSHMALRDNTSVLFAITALILLLHGWQKRHYGWTLLGGFAAGLTFYTYYPSRITIFIWLGFVVLATIAARFANWRTAGKLAGTAILGLAMVAAPLFIANSKHVITDPYPHHQYLWQKEARAQEQQFRGTATAAEAVKINILHGLAVFNYPYSDQGLLYPHEGYGFVDKITGILVWMGVVVVLMQLAYKRRPSEGDLLALAGFFMLYLSLSFLLTRAPDYTRLLIILPFVGYMIGRLVVVAAEFLGWLWRGKKLAHIWPWVLTTAVIITLAGANAVIVRDYVRLGNIGGDSVGDTLRFQEKHVNENARWLFVHGGNTTYFYWGIPAYWQFWLNFAAGQDKPVTMYTVQDFLAANSATLSSGAVGRPGYLFTTAETWQTVQADFESKVQVLQVTPLDNGGNRVVITYSDR